MKYRELSAPLSLQVEITEACNNRCIHCYNFWREADKQLCLTRLSALQLETIAGIAIENKIFAVTLTGGEPLLFWRILPPVIQKLRATGIDVSLNSNLTVMNDEIAQALKNSGLNSVLVSLLSHRAEIHDEISNHKGAWKKTIDGIKIVVSHGFRVAVNMVLLKSNYCDLYQTAELAQTLGVKSFCATKASPALNARDFTSLAIDTQELKQSLVQLETIRSKLGISVDILECYPLCLIGDAARFDYFARRSCTAGVTTCTVGSNGDIRPCSHADMVYGNIFREPFCDIWFRMDDWRNGAYIPKECLGCKFVAACSGGCRMEAKYYGNICGKDPHMTGPDDVIKLPVVDTKSGCNIRPDDRFKITENLQVRQEKFGATINIPIKGTFFVNKDAFRIISYCLYQKSFTLSQLSADTGITIDTLVKFISMCLNKSIVLRS